MSDDPTSSSASREQQLADLAELVATGPVELGSYTQAEMAVVLGAVPALAGDADVVLAEAVRSLAARGVLHRVPGERQVELVGDLGLMVALAEHTVGTLEIRRGHPGAADAQWRWMISLFGEHVVGLDRIDALGLHRLSLYSVAGIIEGVADSLIDGHARVPHGHPAPEPISDDEVRALAGSAERRWQLIHRVRGADGAGLAVDSLVVRVGDDRVDLVTHDPSGPGYRRIAVDSARLRDFLGGLFGLRAAHAGDGGQ